MFKVNRLVVTILLFCILTSLFLIAFSSAQLTDSSILKMQGSNWSISVDSTLQTDLASKNAPYVSVAKAGAEKELFLTLNSLEDCKAGQIEFKVATQGLTVYKQLPLDKELNAADYDFLNATVAMRKEQVLVSRPENVVNSFACYDSTGKKVLHIYASQLIDAKGNKVYVDSELKDGLLTVYLDQKWLDSAVFPVTGDPTFGYTSVGGSSYNSWNQGETRGSLFNLAENGDVTNITVHCHSASTWEAKCEIRANNGGSLGSVLGTTEVGSVETTGDWYTFNFASPVYLTSNDYWLVILNGNGDMVNYFLEYDTGSTGQGYSQSEGYGTWKFSIYATYTVSGEPTPTPTSTPTNSPNTITISASSTLYVNLVLLLFFVLADLYFCLRPVKLLNFIVGFFGIVVVLGVMSAGALGGAWF